MATTISMNYILQQLQKNTVINAKSKPSPPEHIFQECQTPAKKFSEEPDVILNY